MNHFATKELQKDVPLFCGEKSQKLLVATLMMIGLHWKSKRPPFSYVGGLCVEPLFLGKGLGIKVINPQRKKTLFTFQKVMLLW